MYSGDMLVNLNTIEKSADAGDTLIKRAMPMDKREIMEFISGEFSPRWAVETEPALVRTPSTCFIAVRDKKVVGFCCFDATARGFVGPMGLSAEVRGAGVGKALLLRTLDAMHEFGYGYAVLGWIGDAAGFFQKTVGARFIEGGEPKNSVYRDMVSMS